MPYTSLTTSDSSITPQIMQDEGTIKAFQSVAQSTALAVQDAVDNLRNVNTISSTAIGVAMAQMLAVPAEAGQYNYCNCCPSLSDYRSGQLSGGWATCRNGAQRLSIEIIV